MGFPPSWTEKEKKVFDLIHKVFVAIRMYRQNQEKIDRIYWLADTLEVIPNYLYMSVRKTPSKLWEFVVSLIETYSEKLSIDDVDSKLIDTLGEKYPFSIEEKLPDSQKQTFHTLNGEKKEVVAKSLSVIQRGIEETHMLAGERDKIKIQYLTELLLKIPQLLLSRKEIFDTKGQKLIKKMDKRRIIFLQEKIS